MIWFTLEEAEMLMTDLERLRVDPEYAEACKIIDDADLPDEFLESWR